MQSMSAAAKVMLVESIREGAPGTLERDAEVEKAWQVLSFFRDVAGDHGAMRNGSADAAAADVQHALDDAHETVLARLRRSVSADFDTTRLLTALSHLSEARMNLRDSILVRRTDSMSGLHAALENLRLADTIDDLLSVGTRQVTRLGFDRCLISRLRDGMWLPRSAHVKNDSALAEAMVEVGTRNARYVNSGLVEADVVRRRAPLLVRDAPRNNRVHPELNMLVRTESYVAAPIVAASNVIGFIHADCRPDGKPVDTGDRETLMMFATVFGVAFERIYYQERLRQVYRHIDAVTAAAPDLFEATDHPSDGPRLVDDLSAHRAAVATGSSALIERLTKREIEVLGYMASGDTNKRIAARLFVSEATIKAHVKHILRKLGAANRAEAVSRYLRNC